MTSKVVVKSHNVVPAPISHVCLHSLSTTMREHSDDELAAGLNECLQIAMRREIKADLAHLG